MVLLFLFSKVFGTNFNFVEDVIRSAVFCVVYSLVTWIGYSDTIFPRIKYLENNDISKPPYKNVCSSTVNTLKEFDFNSIKTIIADKWIITFYDDVAKVLKFRTKIGLFKSWGTAARLQYDSNVGILYIDCFTFTGHDHKHALNMQKEIEDCFTNLTNET